jgi:heme-degrading monooxygenase HmoA
MILEHALLLVSPERTVEFEEAFDRAKTVIASSAGFVSLTLSKGIEHPATYLLLVQWDSVEAHEEGFRGSPAYDEWRALLHHFYDPFPVVEHFAGVVRVG